MKGLQPIDLSVLPEDVREKVKSLPREEQKKIVGAYASPAGQDSIKENEDKAGKAEEVKTKTRQLVSELLGNIDGIKAVAGGFDEMTPTFFDSSKDAEAAMDDLKNLLTVENLKLMTGVLSESDIAILRSVGSSGLSGSQDRIIETLQKIDQAVGGQKTIGRFKVQVK